MLGLDLIFINYLVCIDQGGTLNFLGIIRAEGLAMRKVKGGGIPAGAPQNFDLRA